MNERTSERANQRTCRFSIIVPVYNDWHRVPELLERLKRQTLDPESFEIILVDNGSERFDPPDSLPPKARIEICTTPGSYAARNHGIEQARGEWLAFTDADCRPKPDWLQNLLEATNARNDETTNRQTDKPTKRQNAPTILAGAVQMVADHDPPNRWETYDLVRGIPQAWYVRRGYAATANLAVPATLMASLGCFDAARLSGGDADLCRRARAAGARLEYVATAAVEHPARSSREEVLAKAKRIKAGQVAAGDWPRRLRTLLPPVIEIWKHLRSAQWPLKYRLTAVAVELRLWPTEFRQAFRPGAIDG